MSEKKLTLSIETAIQGGSISVLRGITELDCWIGLREISKSEDVLQEIKSIFERNNLKKNEIKRIIVSEGPGSHTGMRIGKATGIGLRKAFNCELVGVFALKAMLLSKAENEDDKELDEIITAVPIGRNQVCRQSFRLQNQKIINYEAEPQVSTIEEFSEFAVTSVFPHKVKVVMHRMLFLGYRTKLENAAAGNSVVIDAGENIARLNGMWNA